MGEDGVDTDIPCKFEAMFLNNVAGKTFFACVKLSLSLSLSLFLLLVPLNLQLTHPFYTVVLLTLRSGLDLDSIFQIFFYALRPTFVRSAGKFTRWHLLNFILVLGLDVVLVRNFGWASVLYLLFSSFFAGSLHPLAGHFIGAFLLSSVPPPPLCLLPSIYHLPFPFPFRAETKR
jgi:sphingolipid delta-4 desaturase